MIHATLEGRVAVEIRERFLVTITTPGREPQRYFVLNDAVINKILTHVGLPTEPPAIAAARAPPQLDLDLQDDWPD
jgi:hypothetical protein